MDGESTLVVAVVVLMGVEARKDVLKPKIPFRCKFHSWPQIS